MATLDAGAIQEIGNSGFNPMGATQAAYTLADTIDKHQLQRMGLKDAQQEQQDLAQIKTLSQKYKLDDPEDQNKFAAEAMRVNPKYGMGLMKEFTASQTGRAQLDREQLALLGDKQNIITSGLLPVYMQGKELKAAGKTDAEINAALLPVVSQTFKMLQGTYQKNGKPLLEPNNLQDAQNLLQSGNILGGLQGMLMKNKDSFETLHKLTTEEQAVNREKTADKRELETERHNRVSEGRLAEITASTIAGREAPPEAELNTLAKSIAEYRVPPMSGTALLKPRNAAIMARVMELNPNYQAQKYKEVDSALRQYDTGQSGKAIKSFNVAIDHLGTLDKMIDALQGGDMKALNRVGNLWKDQTGGTAPGDFRAVSQIVGDELVKAVTGSGGALGDREELKANLDAAKSPGQLRSIVSRYKELMGGQLVGQEQGYRSSTGLSDFADRLLTPAAREEYNRHKSPTPTSAQAAVPPGSTPAASGAGSTPPASALKAGTVTHFANGQNWTLGPDGKPQQVK